MRPRDGETLRRDDEPVVAASETIASQTLGVSPPRIEWSKVNRVLVVKLRSIGDTVLSTPTLIALRRFLPEAQIDILLEDWVAPVLEGFDQVDNIISVGKGSAERLKVAARLRRGRYDVAINLHGGTTATFFTAATGAKHRIGYSYYQYPFLYNHLLSSSNDFWNAEFTHSAEQQLALVGFAGIPVNDRPKSRLAVTEAALKSVEAKLNAKGHENSGSYTNADFALLHPATAFLTKQWPTENFARTAEYLSKKGIATIAVAAKNEAPVLESLKAASRVPILTFDDLILPEIAALVSKAKLFVGNDSGIAHIAAAVQTPTVVIFGSSNRNHWRPWTDAPNEIVYEQFPCQPCAGYECKEFGEPRCILGINPKAIIATIDRILNKKHRIF